jgi:MYXO-CTERM domain-containing protein
LLAGPARAHISLSSPPARTEFQKDGPCGAGADQRGPTLATFKPGEKIVVTWTETVNHPGHFRIALDPDGQDGFFEPKAFDDVSGGPGVIVDGIADKDGGEYSQEITLPNIECDSCVLQLIQVMTDKKPYGDGNDLYYQCADIAIVGEMVGTTGEPGSTGPDTTTSGASDPSAGETGTTGEPGSTGGGETAAGNTGGDEPTTGPATGDASTGGGTGGGSTGDASSGGDSSGTTDGASEGSGCGCRGDAGGPRGAGWLALGLLSVLVRRRHA